MINFPNNKTVKKMKASKFSERQIVAILKSQTADKTLAQICREHGIAPATFYHWKKK